MANRVCDDYMKPMVAWAAPRGFEFFQPLEYYTLQYELFSC